MREKSDRPEDVLYEDHKKMHEARGILARLFRKILADEHFTMERWERAMNVYLDDPRNGIPQNSRFRSSHRGNIHKELFNPDMTWNVFKKGLTFLGMVGIKMEIHAEWASGKKTSHAVILATADRRRSVHYSQLHDTDTVDDEPAAPKESPWFPPRRTPDTTPDQ